MGFSLVVCRSLTYAQRAAHLLERYGVTAQVTRPPLQYTEGACGYAVRVKSNIVSKALNILVDNGFKPRAVYSECREGHWVRR